MSTAESRHHIETDSGQAGMTTINYRLSTDFYFQIKIKIDHHIHGAPWEYGWANYRRSVWNGWNNGCNIIGIAEHGPRLNHRVPFRSLYFADFDHYFNTIEEIRLEFQGHCDILTGFELDYHPDMVEHYREVLPQLPLDFVIGAVHSIEDWIVDNPVSLKNSSFKDADAYELYHIYFNAVREAAETGLFNFIAHPDMVKKALPHAGMKKPDNLSKLYRETADILKACDTGIEVNTRGLILSDVGEFYPDFEFLSACAQAEVPVTIGSDSHDSNRVGESFEEAVDFIRQAGYKKICYYKSRRITFVEI